MRLIDLTQVKQVLDQWLWDHGHRTKSGHAQPELVIPSNTKSVIASPASTTASLAKQCLPWLTPPPHENLAPDDAGGTTMGIGVRVRLPSSATATPPPNWWSEANS